jgi:sterol desaturase/sphingolipid hydroxylase (fatty acid hydroxylase superfamily)
MSWLEIGTLAVLPVFLLLDFAQAPPRARSRWWRTRAFAITALSFGLALWLGQLYGRWFGDRHLVDGALLGTPLGAGVGVLVYECCHYWYHRCAHRFEWLWRLGHQMHHSAETLDAWGAYYLHPIDAAIFASLPSVVLFPVLGLSPEAGAWAAAFIGFCGVFQHAQVRTPRWLGYLIQRPESHAIHHARNVHAFNYADLPLWDMVFGTFRNGPAVGTPLPRQGFYDGASARVWEMLAFRDVSRPAHRRATGA